MSEVIFKDVENKLEKAEPGSLQQDTNRERYKDKIEESYTKEQVVSIKSELELIEAFLKDIEAIKEPDAKLKLWEKEMRDIADEAKTIIGIYKSSRVDEKIIFTRLASIIKNRKANSKERLLTVDEPRRCIIAIVGMGGSGKQSLQDELKQMLQNFLREKKYLIVLDNIPMSGVWDDVKGAFPDVSNGSRIVITTCDMAVPHIDSRIFQYKEVPPELKDVGRKIVIRCGGLPLEIVNMGKLLLKKVEDFKEDRRPGTLIRNLRKKFEIPARRLITLWVAEGFLRTCWGDHSPEQFAEKYLMELIDRNMVQVTKKKPNGRARSCCLPVALRKHLSKAVEDKVFKGQVSTASKSSSSLQQNRWIVDHYNNIDPSNTSFNHIHGDNSDNATLQAFYKKCFLLLRVLDLERVFRPQLPKQLAETPNTRCEAHLHQFSTSIYLEDETIAALLLSESYRSRFGRIGPQPRGASLEDLQTLWGAFVDEKSPVRDGLDTMINLRKLSVACRCMSNQKDAMSLQLEAVAEWIQKLKHLQS
uniref:Disease resistance protein n=1 Tax=Quercus lobata TaxID=97700 RepID=A0A7N2MSY4_QUELO